MATVNNIIDQISLKVGHPFDHSMKELIREDVLQTSATILRQDARRYFSDDFTKIPYFAEVELVDSLDNCLITSGCKTLKRTSSQIPMSVRVHIDVPFDFVGTMDNSPYMYVRSGGEIKVAKSIPIRSKARMYFIENLYIYLYNYTHEKYIKVIGVFENIEEVINICKVDCYDSDVTLPIPNDILGRVVGIVANMILNNPKYKDLEIEINDKIGEDIQGQPTKG
jgi:hypothetical protein